MNDKTIRLNIRNIRTSKKLTQAEVADMLGISRQAYVKFEHGNTSIINRQIPKMAAVLDVTEEELMFGYKPEDFKAPSLRERSLWEEKLCVLREEKESELASKEDKISSLVALLESEKLHIRTQLKYTESLESQLMDGRKQITELRRIVSDLRRQVKQLDR